MPKHTQKQITHSTRGVDVGERGETPLPQIFFGGNAVPPNDIKTRGNGDTVAFH